MPIPVEELERMRAPRRGQVLAFLERNQDTAWSIYELWGELCDSIPELSLQEVSQYLDELEKSGKILGRIISYYCVKEKA